MTLTRRSLLRRAVASLGSLLMLQKFPEAVRAAHLDDRAPEPLAPLFEIAHCTFVRGNPANNDPDWIEDTGSGLLLRNKTLEIDGILRISQPVRLILRDSTLYMPVHLLQPGWGSVITRNHVILTEFWTDDERKQIAAINFGGVLA